MFDYLIVGAGFAGSVCAERLASQLGKRILIIHKRLHIAGNIYDHYDDAGVLVHKYGPHIVHTTSRDVFGYRSQFTAWHPYEHRVRASVDGQLVPLPINYDTLNQLSGLQLTTLQVAGFLAERAETPVQIRPSEDVVVGEVGRELYEKFFRGYTRKQWGLDPAELDAPVTARVPKRANRAARCFTDTYQPVPRHGYTRLFERMLAHPGIKVMLNTDFREVDGLVPYRELIYTSPVDAFFDYRYGALPHRSLKQAWSTRFRAPRATSTIRSRAPKMSPSTGATRHWRRQRRGAGLSDGWRHTSISTWIRSLLQGLKVYRDIAARETADHPGVKRLVRETARPARWLDGPGVIPDSATGVAADAPLSASMPHAVEVDHQGNLVHTAPCSPCIRSPAPMVSVRALVPGGAAKS